MVERKELTDLDIDRAEPGEWSAPLEKVADFSLAHRFSRHWRRGGVGVSLWRTPLVEFLDGGDWCP